LAVGGCDPVDREYFKRGIGTELNPGDIAAAASAQDEYVTYICEQAGIQPAGYGVCGAQPTSPQTWQVFVQAGMNDIDQRCDAYLTWLDYVRRAREPTLKTLADAQSATTVIMGQSGIGAAPIAIAAAAFGFATSTLTNVTSRLILEVDHSTVQVVVLSHQKQYREELLGSADNRTAVVIASRPAAIYALRSYLRLCMPMTIETQINTIMTTFSRGGTNALDAGEPMITAATVGVARITDPNAPIPPGPKPSPAPLGAIGPIEQKLTTRTIKNYQNALCVAPADGKLGQQTRAAVSEYLKLTNQPDASAEFDRRTPGLLQDAVDGVGSCRGKFLTNVYEVVNYGMANNPQKAITSLQTELASALKTGGSKTALEINGRFTDDSALGDPTRNAIAEVRKILHPADAAAQNIKLPKNRQLDAAFETDLATTPQRR
jgi:hypothetical protein